MRQLSRAAAPALAGLLLGVIAIWRGLGWGFVLRYDMVFVPDPPIWPDRGGLPRAIPSDVVVAVLSHVIPGELVQKLILLGIFVLAASGAAALVDKGRLAAAVFYAWNLYLAQRLLLGQWALLLGYAGLPWAVYATVRRRWLPAALLPAAIGGFQAMLVSALTLIPVACWTSRRRVAEVTGWLTVLSLPWLIPALLSRVTTDPAGVDAFAARADGPFGTLGSLLGLGGIWNADVGVPDQGFAPLAAIRLLVCLAALWGAVRLTREERWARGLAVAAAAGLLIALTGAFLPGLLRALITWWPGFGPLRDGQAYIAPLALLEALGFARLVGGLPGAAVVPVLLLPTLAFGAFGRIAAVSYPSDWEVVRRVVDGDPTPGALLTLPWSAYRAYPWNSGRIMLDPSIKFFKRRVVWNDSLVVGLPGGGGAITVPSEDPLARRVGALLETTGPVRAQLVESGIRYVLIDRSNENAFLSRLTGAESLLTSQNLLLLRL
ncbi:hypothetical protein J5X84_02800 [Streptosporangiaceae bacterium NEAU-GS5]|nr:hypothetical protein [Streptosporangiaceae bacterium NEAU-GS5]